MPVNIEINPFEKIKIGVDKLSNTVALTLGPCGKNIFIDMGGDNTPLSTRDGVTVAQYVNLKDRLEDFGAKVIKQAAKNTNQNAGDGTTTATVLAQAIFNEGLKYIAAGESPIKIKRSIDEAVLSAVERLKNIAIRDNVNLFNVATISANNDPFLGRLIADAIEKVGKDGSILVEDSPKNETALKFQEGMTIERGWGETSFYFINNMAKASVEYDNPHFLVIDDKIDSFETLDHIVRYIAKEKIATIMLIRDIEDTVLAWLVTNKLKGGLKLAVIKTPGFNNPELIEDFADRVGARPFNPDWNPLNSFKPEDLGFAKRVVIGKSSTTVIEGRGDITQRLVRLDGQAKDEADPVRRGRILDRVNKLNGSIATLQLSADSETEMKDKKLRVEDAINASRSAAEEGIVPGSGKAFLLIRGQNLTIGEKIINFALEQPIKKIIENTGENIERILVGIEGKPATFGYDANARELCDLIERGIIDPVKVSRTALTKAASAAGMLLLTGHCIVNEVVEKKC